MPCDRASTYRDNVVVVLMQDGLTQAERTVAAGGGEDTVRSVRPDLSTEVFVLDAPV